MPSSDPRRRALRRRRRSLALLVGVTSILGIGGSIPAQAQDEGQAVRGEELFGAYQLDARGSGVQGIYAIEGLLPGGAPVMDLTLPETLAQFSSGPSGYGLASLIYPGGVLVNLGSLAAQAGGPSEGIPEYPIKAEAFYPAGPVEAGSSQSGGIQQKVVTNDMGVQVDASFPAIEAAPIVSVGSITSASRTSIEGTMAVSRVRVALGDVQILGGVISIGSLVTDLVAAHDGTTGSTSGGTTASDVTFLGLDASLTGDGLTLAPSAIPSDSLLGPLGPLLGDLAGPLNDIVGPVQEQLVAVLDQAIPQLNDLLGQAGIEIRLLDPREEQVPSGAATRITTGLSLTFSYKGKEQEALVDLVNSIPAELKPGLGPLPSPITFLTENHVMGLSLGPATVSALATPPFPTFDVTLPDLPLETPSFDGGGTGGFADPGFATAPAPLPEAAASPDPGPLTEPVSNAVGGALPAALVALALLASPLFGIGSTRLADNVLAPAATPCPIGLDKPAAPRRSP